jgi:hypothetical protein
VPAAAQVAADELYDYKAGTVFFEPPLTVGALSYFIVRSVCA